MAASKSVVVLAPNGRRQNVKVTPNTTMLQVLEEVCRKHEFNADEFDLKHYNKILDADAMFRFTGLTNNALLEMIPRAKPRPKSDVVIGIQLEDGQRLTGEFAPDTTLAEILRRLCPDRDLEKTALIYTHREVCGPDDLENTTLKLLGLASGRAMLRLASRDPDRPKSQANVGVPLGPKIRRTTDDAVPSTSTSSTTRDRGGNSVFPPHAFDVAENHQLWSGTDADVEENFPEVEPLADRDGLVYNQLDVCDRPSSNEELPDDFYDLTVEDAKILLRDAKRRREQLEEAPLLTAAQRRCQKYKRMMDTLGRYRYTLVRIQFPDGFVLQGKFASLETVRAIKDFVGGHLEDPSCEFTIYTSPPKNVLDPEARLIKANLVPSAIVHYSGSSRLRADIKEKAVHPRIAELRAIKTRLEIIGQNDVSAAKEEVEESKTKNDDADCKTNSGTRGVPKWFNLSSR